MALSDLDAFVAHAREHQQLSEALQQPLTLDAFLALAAGAGFSLSEADVLAAQAGADEARSAAERQARAGDDARKLRSFIPG